MHYTAKERIPDPSFIVSIDHVDGQSMWSNHTKDADYLPADVRPGPGSLDVVIPALNFRPGTFYINGSVHSSDGGVLDCLNRSLKMTVIAGDPKESGGLVALGSHFDEMTPERPMKKAKAPGQGPVDLETYVSPHKRGEDRRQRS